MDDVIELLHEHWLRHGTGPTVNELSRSMGIKPPSVTGRLKRLVDSGMATAKFANGRMVPRTCKPTTAPPKSMRVAGHGNAWSRAEVEALVDEYLWIMGAESAGIRVNRAERMRGLYSKLSGRNPSRLCRKMQDISKVLSDMGMRWLHGYTPTAHSHQALGCQYQELRNALLARMM